MPARLNLLGEKFGRLTVIGDAGSTKSGKSKWHCLCECGSELDVPCGTLRSLHTTSCGCISKEMVIARNTTHGFADRVPEYRTWQAMRDRCLNPNTAKAKNYSARGILICPEWSSFEQFFVDMGLRPSPQHSLDRINNNGNYCKENCRWAPASQQAQNKTNNIQIEHDGLRLCITEWSRRLGFSRSTINDRLRRGWTPERALTQPLRK